jgi:hypothetical protein
VYHGTNWSQRVCGDLGKLGADNNIAVRHPTLDDERHGHTIESLTTPVILIGINDDEQYPQIGTRLKPLSSTPGIPDLRLPRTSLAAFGITSQALLCPHDIFAGSFRSSLMPRHRGILWLRQKSGSTCISKLRGSAPQKRDYGIFSRSSLLLYNHPKVQHGKHTSCCSMSCLSSLS